MGSTYSVSVGSALDFLIEPVSVACLYERRKKCKLRAPSGFIDINPGGSVSIPF